MGNRSWVAVVAVVLLAGTSALDVVPDSDIQVAGSQVVVLTDDNFEEQTAKGGTWFIKFYAPWCGHCKALAPVWDELPDHLPSDVTVAKVDATEQATLASRFEVQGYPSMFLIADAGTPEAQLFEYNGGRSTEKLVAFATGGYTSTAGNPVPSLTPSKKGEGGEVVVLTSENLDDEMKAKGGAWFIKFYAPWCGHCKSLAPVWDDLPSYVGGDVSIAKVDVTENRDLGERFGIKGFPTLLLIADAGTPEALLYKYSGQRKAESLAAFASGGYKSDTGSAVPAAPKPIAPREPGDSDLIILTDGNFSAVDDGVWLVMFYAPWCPHCQKLEPVWENLGTKHNKEGSGNTHIAKLDAVQHSATARRMKLTGYPTVYKFAEGNYSVYEGQRGEADFEAFISNKQESEPIPSIPGLLEELEDVFEHLKEDFVHMWNFKKMILGIVYALGIASGAILVALLTPSPQPAARRPKAQPQTEAKAKAKAKAKPASPAKGGSSPKKAN